MLSFHIINGKVELCDIQSECGKYICTTHHVEVEKVFKTKEK